MHEIMRSRAQTIAIILSKYKKKTQSRARKGESFEVRSSGDPNSPEFKQWFKGSKMVNEDGTPRVLYHGGAANIDEFDLSKVGTVLRSDWGDGIYLTPSRVMADSYREGAVKHNDAESNRLWDVLEAEAKKRGTTPMMAAIDLGFQTPKYNELMEFDKAWRARLKVVEADKTGGMVYPLHVKMVNPLIETGWAGTGMTDPFMAKRAKEAGHDGIIIDPGTSMEEIIVFSPDQVRLAPTTFASKSAPKKLQRVITKLKQKRVRA
jgi:hypothetical protein